MKPSTIPAALGALALTLSTAACSSTSGADEPVRAAGSDRTNTTTTTSAAAPLPRPTEPVDELVAVADGRLHLRCSGGGDSTVLLLAGWDHASPDWAGIEPSIAQHARVCSYDRFGTGTSDAAATPQTFETQVADLHELLEAAGEPGPYVVVGHSFGGAEAVTFAATHPDEVAAVMLVDASPTTWPSTVCSIPAYASGCALMRNPAQGERLDVFPAFEAVAGIRSLGDLPLTVLTATERTTDGLTPEERTELHARWNEGTEHWTTLSTRSRLVAVEDSGHAIQIDQPGVVLAELVELLP